MLRVLRGLSGRQEDVVHQPESVLQHFRDNTTQQTAADLQRRVSVDLTQPRLAPRIHQIVQTEQLETNPPTVSNQPLIPHRTAYVPTNPLNFRQDLGIEIESGVVETVLVELMVRQFVGRLEFVVVRHVLLNGVVGQMDTLGHLLRREFLRSSANVTLLVHIELQSLVDLHPQHVAPDVKFTLFVQQRIYVLLQQVSLLLRPRWMYQQVVQGVLRTPEHRNPSPPIGKLPRLQNPNVLLPPHFLYNLLPIKTSDVIRFGYELIWILALPIVVIDHVSEEQFLVSNLLAVGQVVINSQSKGQYL
jgi:hypothetical protein